MKSLPNNNGDQLIGTVSTDITKKRYSDILLKYSNCECLVDNFLQESYPLRMSDAHNVNYSIESSMQRMMEGYVITYFDFKTGIAHKIEIVIDSIGLVLKFPFNSMARYKFELLGGIVLGAQTGTFCLLTSRGISLKHLGFEENDCFSVLTEFHSIDFASPSDRAKYDFITVLSFICSARNGLNSPCTYLSKSKLMTYRVISKIRKMALERKLNVKELFLVIFKQLAIIKTLIFYNYNSRSIDKVKSVLNASFSHSAKIYRIVTHYSPKSRPITPRRRAILGESLRLLVLKKRKDFNLKNKDIVHIKKLKYHKMHTRLSRISQVIS